MSSPAPSNAEQWIDPFDAINSPAGLPEAFTLLTLREVQQRDTSYALEIAAVVRQGTQHPLVDHRAAAEIQEAQDAGLDTSSLTHPVANESHLYIPPVNVRSGKLAIANFGGLSAMPATTAADYISLLPSGRRARALEAYVPYGEETSIRPITLQRAYGQAILCATKAPVRLSDYVDAALGLLRDNTTQLHADTLDLSLVRLGRAWSKCLTEKPTPRKTPVKNIRVLL